MSGILYSGTDSMSAPAFGQWLFDWQTLIGATLAIFAAAASVWYLRMQIGQADEHEQSRLQRRLDAARATLPLTLSGITDYAKASVAELLKFHNEVNDDGVVSAGIEFCPPSAPVELVPALERMIEACGEPLVRARLAKLVSEIQIFDSRLSDTAAKTSHSFTLEDWIETLVIQSAVVYAQASSLFLYARRRTEEVNAEITWADVTNAMNSMGLWDHYVPGAWKKVHDREARGIPPES